MKIVSIGEILWDVFPSGEHLGGAPFNFAAHARRLGHEVLFISAVGDDERGHRALDRALALGLPPEFIRVVPGAATGTVTVRLDAAGQPAFTIHRPAAYDLLRLGDRDYSTLAAFSPDWIYHGTLFFTSPVLLALLRTLTGAVPNARTFYDVNLRPASYTLELVRDLLSSADAVKLNEDEARVIAGTTDDPKPFLRSGPAAVAITRGERGCIVATADDCAEVAGFAVDVKDAVGAGDAFAAAFLHGLGERWSAARIGEFANRLGALVASRPGAVPDWTPEDYRSLSRS